MTDISPREFGRLEAEVESLRGEVAGLRDDVKELLELANRSRGGLWTGMAMASALGGVATWVAERLVK